MTTARRLDADWLREGVLGRLLGLLNSEGEEARVVGGAVRNALIGEPPGDVDIATTALPAEVIRRVETEGFRGVPTGIDHGTVTVVAQGRPYEVTTLREDVETDGRHAKVAFGRDWKADAQRRDFTINALSVTADGVVHDTTGGLDDLDARRVRFIGDPDRRIAEDYLRILRFFRFHAAYGEGLPDPAGLHACIAARAGLDQLSRERVRMEMLKLMLTRHAVPALAVMAEAGLLVTVLGGVPLLAAFSNMIKVEHAAGLAGDPVRRLGALGMFVTEDAERLAQRLRLSGNEAARLHGMIEGWSRVDPENGEQAARALLYRIGADAYVDRTLLAWAKSDAGAHDARWRELVTLPERWVVPVFPLKASAFMARGIEKGPRLGAALRAAEEAWIGADFPTDDVLLRAIADDAVSAD